MQTPWAAGQSEKTVRDAVGREEELGALGQPKLLEAGGIGVGVGD